MLTSFCGAALGAIFALGLGLAGVGAGVGTSVVSPLAGIGIAGASALGGILIAFLACFSFFIGIGIYRSRRWAFVAGALWYGLGVLCGSGGKEDGALMTLVSIGVCVYCILRLAGKLGNTP